VGAAADLLVQPFERVVAPQLPPVFLRKRCKGEQVGRCLLEQRGRFGEATRELIDDPAVLLVHVTASGCAKIVRTIVATNDWALFGTRVSRLRMKCVRQRCQLAPGSVAAIASTRPGCASELTRRTPARPRATSE